MAESITAALADVGAIPTTTISAEQEVPCQLHTILLCHRRTLRQLWIHVMFASIDDKLEIEDIGLVGVREMYNSLGVPVPGMVEAINCLKKASNTDWIQF